MKAVKLAGIDANKIVEMLEDNPSIFSLKNHGIYILAEHVEHTKETGVRVVLKFTLSDEEKHGVVNDGHTFMPFCRIWEKVTLMHRVRHSSSCI